MVDPVLHYPANPHFFQPLLPGFDSHLNIPVKFFSVHIQGRNKGNTVELRSDASEKSWQVKMESRRLTVGWKEFASAHDFRIGDIIIFKHEGDLVFHVTGFGPSFCEVQYVNPSDQDNIRNLSMEQSLKAEQESLLDQGKLLRKKHVKKRIPEAEAKSFSSDQSCFVAHVTDSNLREDTLFFSKKFSMSDDLKKGSNKIIVKDEGVSTWTLILKYRDSSRTFYMRAGWRRFCRKNGLKPGDSIKFKLESNNTKTPLLCFSTAKCKTVSTKDRRKGKRKITGESRERASSSSTERQFVTLTATPASIKRCIFYFPMRFTRANKMEKAGGKEITLLDKHGVKWPVNLLIEEGKGRMHLGRGFKAFINAIGIEAYDSIVLELVWEETTIPMLKFCSKIKTLH
ncbi:B3 domain-containing protein REM7 [Cardamine amara subsp. amara]|uniref:B3 domain-containing protein REM7 n=1 Tax=Cardamine amara subsp. amara TaxID=228776 RepID=A0ABD1AUJ9_CARAN